MGKRRKPKYDPKEPSIMVKDMSKCIICGTTYRVKWHHCMHGPFRDKATKYKLLVPVCQYHHTEGKYSIHNCADIDKELKKIAQKKFEEIYSRELWLKEFEENYLDEE